jgi:diguanylate cyclase (GGDEF)-like protein/PAS domain S-box-containing protein
MGLGLNVMIAAHEKHQALNSNDNNDSDVLIDAKVLSLALNDTTFLTNIHQLGHEFGLECAVKAQDSTLPSGVQPTTAEHSSQTGAHLPAAFPLYVNRHQVATLHIIKTSHEDHSSANHQLSNILNGFRLAVQQQLILKLDSLNFQHQALPHNFGLWQWQFGNKQIVFSDKCLHLLSMPDPEQKVYPHKSTTLSIREVLHKTYPHDRKILTAALRTLLMGQRPIMDCETRFRYDNGEYLWLRHRAKVNDDHAVTKQKYIIGSSVNIQQRKTDHEQIFDLCHQLQATEQRYRHLMQYASDAIIIIDQDNGRIIDANQQAQDLSYYSLKELFELKYTAILSPNPQDQAYETETCVLKAGLHYDKRLRQKNGHYLAVDIGCTSLEMSGYRLRQCIIHDISEHKAVQEQLLQLANHDPLTLLPNRLLFRDRLNQALLKAERNHTMVALCFFDLDNFKRINDANSHAAGDFVLIEVAKRIQRELRASDTTARIGGDEFVAILEGINNHDTITSVISKILNQIRQPIFFNDAEITVTCSIGVSIYPTTTTELNKLVHYADTAMYSAKKMGNCLQFSPILNRVITT